MPQFDLNRPLYFQHIPKTAGTSVRAMLQSALGERLCPLIHWDELLVLPAEQLQSYSAFSGHFSAYLARFLGRPLNTFTLLRDPVERTISHYAHIRRASHHVFHHTAKDLSLLQFVHHPVTRHNVENYQARYIADLGIHPIEVASALEAPAGAITPLQMHIDEMSRSASPGDLRRAAIAALDTFFLVGVVENVAHHMLQLGEIMGVSLGSMIVANVAPECGGRDQVDADTLRAIRDATAVDQELYETVLSRAAEQC